MSMTKKEYPGWVNWVLKIAIGLGCVGEFVVAMLVCNVALTQVVMMPLSVKVGIDVPRWIASIVTSSAVSLYMIKRYGYPLLLKNAKNAKNGGKNAKNDRKNVKK